MTSELWMAAGGGLLIGTAAVLLLSLTGRIAGISGILWGALTERTANLWRWLFLIGMVVGGALAHTWFAIPIPASNSLTTGWAVLGGLLVGIGTRVGSGCTSGHGVCGIGFRSRRSILATLTFMATGIATVSVLRHMLELPL